MASTGRRGSLATDEGRVAVAQDVTERKVAEQRLARLHGAVTTLSECNQRLVRAEDEATLLLWICDAIVDNGGYRLAWIGYAEADNRKKSVRPVAQAGYEAGNLETLRISWADRAARRLAEGCSAALVPLWLAWRRPRGGGHDAGDP